MSLAAIILAAGESTRMGRLKQVLPWQGTTLLDWQVTQMREAGVDDVVVVLGHEAAQVQAAISGSAARTVINESYRQGRATSLRKGAEALTAGTESILVLSVDQPRPAWLSRRLIERWLQTSALIVSPRFEGGYGHPILIDGSLIEELRRVNDESLGLRAVIDRHVDRAETVDVENAAVDVDLNTPQAYAEALASLSRGEWNHSAI